MHRRMFLSLVAVLLSAYAGAAIAQPGEASLQSPRKALIEMFSGSDEKFRQHLTVDVQQKMGDLLKSARPGSSPLQVLASATTGQKWESFESGPILFSLNDAQQHQRYEVHIDAEELRGDEDVMELSVHSFRGGIEEEMATGLRLQLGLTLQQSVWRLNALTLILKFPVGDPRILEGAWWIPQMAANPTALDQGTRAAADRQPRLSPLRAVRLIALAENLYAQRHPEIGYTCAIANLVNVGKGLDENGPYTFLEPEFASGVYNGYSFGIKGCERSPAKTFQVVAEPVSGKGKAYCSDDRHNLRSSEDGHASTCLAAGKFARQ